MSEMQINAGAVALEARLGTLQQAANDAQTSLLTITGERDAVRGQLTGAQAELATARGQLTAANDAALAARGEVLKRMRENNAFMGVLSQGYWDTGNK